MKSFFRNKIVTGAIILDEGNKVLLVKRADSENTLPGFWELPGGKKIGEETNEDCIKREVKEEVGLEFEGLTSAPSFTYELDKGEYIERATQVNFIISFPSGGLIHLSPEHSEYAWVKVEDLDKLNITDNIKLLLNKITL